MISNNQYNLVLINIDPNCTTVTNPSKSNDTPPANASDLLLPFDGIVLA